MPLFLMLLLAPLFALFETDGGAGGGDDSGGDNGAGGDGDTAGSGGGDGSGDEDVSGLKSALQAERRTNDAIKKFAKERGITVAKAIEAFVNAENAGKSEAERLEQRAKDAETAAETALTKLRTANARSAITDAAQKANAISPTAVFALVRDGLEYDDDGEPTNVPALLKAIQTQEPGLFRKSGGRADGGETGGTAAADGVSQMNDFIRQQARKTGR